MAKKIISKLRNFDVLFWYFLKIHQMFPTKNKILISCIGGLGDIIVRQKIIDLIAQKYGKENIVVIVRNNPEIIEFFGYKPLFFEKNAHLKLSNLLETYKYIAKTGFKEFYALEMGGSKSILFLKKYDFEKVTGYECDPMKKWHGHYKKILIPTKRDSVLDAVYELAVVIDKNITKNSLIPEINVPHDVENYISLGVGASGREKICSPAKLAEFLNYVAEKDPTVKFHLLGNGKHEEMYGKYLKTMIDNNKIIDKIGKIELREVLSEIASSKMYIGFDSGLYNLAYALNKNIIMLASAAEYSAFHHKRENIKIILRDQNKKTKPLNDPQYNNTEMNGIDLSDFAATFDSFDL